METQEQIERIEHFIREVIVDEITKLQGVGLSYMQFVIMGQAIEVLGSFLDNKPMKAKGQSAKRFSLGVPNDSHVHSREWFDIIESSGQ